MFFDKFKKGPYEPGTRSSLYKDGSDLLEKEIQRDLTYTINDYGYRGEILPGKSAAFGCSITLGFFVSEEEHWPSLLGIFNGAITAASNDMIARQCVSYISQYTPETVYVMWTYPSRREIVDDQGKLIKYCASDVDIKSSNELLMAQTVLSNEQSDKYNIQKNKLLVEAVAYKHNTRLVSIDKDIIDRYDYLPLACNGHHPGPRWHQAVANHLRHTQ